MLKTLNSLLLPMLINNFTLKAICCEYNVKNQVFFIEKHDMQYIIKTDIIRFKVRYKNTFLFFSINLRVNEDFDIFQFKKSLSTSISNFEKIEYLEPCAEHIDFIFNIGFLIWGDLYNILVATRGTSFESAFKEKILFLFEKHNNSFLNAYDDLICNTDIKNIGCFSN